MGSGKPLESVSRSVMSELALGRLIWPGEKKVLGHVLGVLNANKTNQSQIWCSVSGKVLVWWETLGLGSTFLLTSSSRLLPHSVGGRAFGVSRPMLLF